MRRIWRWLEWLVMCICNGLDDMDEHAAEFKAIKLPMEAPRVRQYDQLHR